MLPFQNLCFTSVKFCSVNPFPFVRPAVNFPPPAPGYHVIGQIPLSHGAWCRCVCKNNTCLRKRILLRNRNAPGRTGCYGQRRDFCDCRECVLWSQLLTLPGAGPAVALLTTGWTHSYHVRAPNVPGIARGWEKPSRKPWRAPWGRPAFAVWQNT